MVNAKGETSVIWVFFAATLAFMAFRFFLRYREKGHWLYGLRTSDYVILTSVINALGACAVMTAMNMQEISFINRSNSGDISSNAPPGAHDPDPVLWIFRDGDREVYFKHMFGLDILVLVSLWLSKFAMLAFYYEVFPKHGRYRMLLHATGLLLLATGITAVFSTVFWCQPISSFWAPDPGDQSDGLCNLRLDVAYIRLQSGIHIGTTGITALIPLVMAAKLDRRGMVFALTVLCLGIVSIGASLGSFATLYHMANADAFGYTASDRHVVIIMFIIDMNVMLWAGALSAVQIRVGRKTVKEGPAALVIEVEQAWTVKVEIAGHWDGRSEEGAFVTSGKRGSRIGGKGMEDIEVAQLTGNGSSVRLRSESAAGSVN